MSDILFTAGAIWGAAWVIADSKLTLPVRSALASRFGESWLLSLLECPACTSFWLGLLFSPIAGPFQRLQFALFTCGMSFLLATFAGVGPARPPHE